MQIQPLRIALLYILVGLSLLTFVHNLQAQTGLSNPVTANAIEPINTVGEDEMKVEYSLSQVEYEIVLEKDVPIQVRDGTTLYADIYRPNAPGKFPVLLAHSPYQKDIDEIYPKPVPGYGSREMPMASYFVPRGYIVVRLDVRGIGKSEGDFDILSLQEAEDAYDAIEWVVQQPWSNGRSSIGGGVGYYSIASWKVASLRPPHLTTMLSWDGDADIYRGQVYRGGMYFSVMGDYLEGVSASQLLKGNPEYNLEGLSNNTFYHNLTNPLFNEYWRSKTPDLDKIDIPVLMTESWGANTLHGRGNIEPFLRMRELGKENIKLRIHDNHDQAMYPECKFAKHTCAFFSEEGLLEQLRWYDYWLKDIDTGIMDEPPVKVWVRGGADGGEFRFENDWPLPDTQWTKFYLDGKNAGAVEGSLNDGSLTDVPSAEQSSISYEAGPSAFGRNMYMGLPTLSFSTSPLNTDTEVTGPVVLKLWVSSETDDMDVVAQFKDMAPDGSVDHLSDGWLKVSHRKLDQALTRDFRPFHSHDEEQKMVPGEVYEVEVEVWPVSHVFKEGHRIRLDIGSYAPGFYSQAPYKTGQKNSIVMSGDHNSYLQLPIIPKR